MSEAGTSDVRIVVTSAPHEAAETLARALVDGGHAACVNLLPGAVAIYRWRGAVERDEEIWMWLETSATAVSQCMDAIANLHPYEVPKILALDPTGVHASYGAWVHDSLVADARSE